MHPSSPLSRAVAGILVVGLLATGGCSWFRKGSSLYAQSPENRPLEVPPALDTSRLGNEGVSASAVAAGTAPASQAPGLGFQMAGTREQAFERVGSALASIPGVSVTGQAQLLGAFDVSYEGSSFLLRVTATDAGAQVAAVDPRGLPAAGDAPRKLIAQLQAALGAP